MRKDILPDLRDLASSAKLGQQEPILETRSVVGSANRSPSTQNLAPHRTSLTSTYTEYVDHCLLFVFYTLPIATLQVEFHES